MGKQKEKVESTSVLQATSICYFVILDFPQEVSSTASNPFFVNHVIASNCYTRVPIDTLVQYSCHSSTSFLLEGPIMVEGGVLYNIQFYSFKVVKVLFTSIANLIGLFYPDKKGQIPKPTNRILFKSAAQLVAEIKGGTLRCEDVVQAFIDRIQEVNNIINAVVDERFDEALKEARQVDLLVKSFLDGNEGVGDELDRKPLLGLPFTAKDSIAIKGMIQAAGYWYRRGYKSPVDAPAVSLMRSRGAIPIALTNVPEILLWWDSTNLIYGQTKNPYDLSRVAGGSSGGEAAIISSCGSVLGLGSDLGGSIRIPSALCGIFGHKPSPNAVSMVGMWPPVNEAFAAYGTFGPMTRYASDLTLGLKGMCEKSVLDKMKLDEPVNLGDIKIFWSDTEGGNPLCSSLQPEIREGIMEVVQHLESNRKMIVKYVVFEKMIHSMHMWAACLKKDDPRSVTDVLGEAKGQAINPFWELSKKLVRKSNHSFNLLWFSLVQLVVGIERDTPAYHKFIRMADRLRSEIKERLVDDGVFIFPTMPEVAPKLKTTAFKGVDVAYCGLMNVLGLPSTHVPLGLTKDGLPFGVQVISAPNNDRYCIAIAVELERQFGGYVPPF